MPALPGGNSVNDDWKKRPIFAKKRAPTEGGPGWYSRGYLPHFDIEGKTQTVIFRLFDSMPQEVLELWRQELVSLPKTMFTPQVGWELGQIAHSWKSYTANECNRVLQRKGEFWQPEPFDRYIRNERHYTNAVRYIEENPVKAGLCNTPEDWRWSSAYLRKK
jgi:putative transposase